jgi:hypothetical protein
MLKQHDFFMEKNLEKIKEILVKYGYSADEIAISETAKNLEELARLIIAFESRKHKEYEQQ